MYGICTHLPRRVTGRSSSIPTVLLNADDMTGESSWQRRHSSGRAAALYSKPRAHDATTRGVARNAFDDPFVQNTRSWLVSTIRFVEIRVKGAESA